MDWTMRFVVCGLWVAGVFDASAEGLDPQFAARIADEGGYQPEQGLRGLRIVIIEAG